MRTTRVIATLGRKALAVSAVLTLLFAFLPGPTAQSVQAEGKLSQDVARKVREAGSDDLIPVIIQTTGDPSSLHFTRLHSRGGLVKAVHKSIRGYSAQVPASQLEGLADDPEVEHVSYDSPVAAHMDVAYPSVKADMAYANSGGLDGRGVGVAVIDTGVIAHLDLVRPMGQGIVEVEIVGHESGLADYYGHGTHVAGIIAGDGSASSDKWAFRTFKGIAPGARIISLRALNPDGTGSTSDVLSAIDWVVNNAFLYNIKVINLSLGHPVYESYATDPLCVAVRRAYNNGIVVVVAAGNDGQVGTGFGTIDSPGNEPNVITVGAMDDRNTAGTDDDVLAPYSSKGPTLVDHIAKPDLVAPGTHIVSLRVAGSYLDTNYHNFTLKLGDYRNDTSTSNKDGFYYDLSGTSMAAPMVAGTAALMLQKEPTLNPASVKARLMLSAVKDNNLVFETGAGYLNVDGALKATGYAAAAPSPVAMLAGDGGVYLQSLSLIWGSFAADSLVWGFSKGATYGITSTSVPRSITQSYGLVWGFCAGDGTIVQNTEITASGLVWGFDACSLIWGSASDSVDSQGAVWHGHH